MKKVLLIGLIVAFALILVGGAGVVYAAVRGIGNNTNVILDKTQYGEKLVQPFGYGPGGMMGGDRDGFDPGGMMGGVGNGMGSGGMMGKRGYGPGNMMGGQGLGLGQGFMHDYVISAFADAVGLSVDEVNTRLANGETLKEIAIAQGKTESDLPALATQVRKAALDKAVAEGVITQAQADLMLERMGDVMGSVFGFGNCPLWDYDDTQQP